MKKICFYFPSRSLGGVQVLFNTLSELMSKDNSVYVIDYSDGYLASNKSEDVKLIIVNENEKQNIPDDSILIIQADNTLNIDEKLNIPDNTKMVFWYLHPYNLKAILPIFRSWQLINWWFIKLIGKTILFFDVKKIRKIITLSHRHNAIFFMDGATYDVCENLLDCHLSNPLYMPVITKDYIVNRSYRFQYEGGKLELCYLGRVDREFKLEMLKKVLKDCDCYSKSKGIDLIFTIIGEGPGLKEIKELSGELDGLSLKFIPKLERLDLVDYLIDNVDVLFAMGMSALEGAKLKIPTVCLDAAYVSVGDDYKYRWLYESKNYSLGYILRNNFIPNENTNSFDELMETFLSDALSISEKTYSFYNEFYNNDINIKLFKNNIISSSLTYGDFKRKCSSLIGMRELLKLLKFSFRWLLKIRCFKKTLGRD